MTKEPVYTVKFASVVKSDVRKLDKQLQRIIKEEHLTSIEKDPLKAVPLLYEFKGLWSYHFNYKGTQRTQQTHVRVLANRCGVTGLVFCPLKSTGIIEAEMKENRSKTLMNKLK